MQIHRTYKLIFIFLVLLVSCKGKNTDRVVQRKGKSTSEELIEVNRILVKKDQLRIKGYVSRMGWNMTETQTGLWYEITQKGDGTKAVPGMLATIDYTLSVLEGSECYSSKKTGPKQFIIGKGNVESGLEQGILFLHQGAEARFILPPHLGYGLPGDGEKIPPRAILIYNIKVLSLTKP